MRRYYFIEKLNDSLFVFALVELIGFSIAMLAMAIFILVNVIGMIF